MVVMAYLSGLISTPAAGLGVWAGMWWWRRLRRAQAEPGAITLELLPPPPLPLPQEEPVLNRMSLRSVPGNRRSLHGRKR